jgi:putative membrane protein (TIGR04086 family)
MTAAICLGGLLSLGVELMILLLGSVAVSCGLLPETAGTQIIAVACVIGCFAGGRGACVQCPSHRQLAGVAVGAVCFFLILLIGLLTADGLEVGAQGAIELAACLCGGALSGLLGGKRKKKKQRLGRRK